MGRRILITVAEVSGDQHAAPFIHALRQLDPSITIEALGGPAMRNAGAVILRETTQRAAMGLAGVGRAIEVWRWLRQTRASFQKAKPDLLVCVDSPAMNFHFAKLARGFGVPVLYYVAPQLWAWREGRMKKLKAWVDRLACILPFEEPYFRAHGVDATFVGHPLFDHVTPRLDNPAASLEGRSPVVGLMAGSRRSEATANFPRMLQVAGKIAAEFPQARFLSPTTHGTHATVMDLLSRDKTGLASAIECRQDAFDEMTPRCDLCITVSGTATLHVAAYGVPMIVVYRANPLLFRALGWLLKTDTFALVNLLADDRRHIVPEAIPWLGHPKHVARMAIDLLGNPQKLSVQRQELIELVRKVGRPGASMNAARIALAMLEHSPNTKDHHS